MTDFDFIGASYERGDGYEKARGLAIYGTDLAKPNMLHGKILRSPVPHALIRSINVEKAKGLKGVHAVVTGRDYPDSQWGRTWPIRPSTAWTGCGTWGRLWRPSPPWMKTRPTRAFT